ncbi:MAG: hypothetical protein JNJ54_28075 [Myxococcaceae bacterium]|nr:hypothetical protein [Myxococcaceae bacterium]
MSRRLPALAMVLACLGCGVRATVLGVQDLDDAATDAGVLLAAPAVSPLSSAACRKAFAPRLPAPCFGGSGPASAQCVMALWPDGGSTLVTSVPTAGTRFIRRLHGVRAGVAIVELADVAAAQPVTLEGAPVDGGVKTTLFTGAPAATLPALTLREAGFDVVSCEATGCTLSTGAWDRAAMALASGVLAPTPSTPIVRSSRGTYAWATDAGVVVSPAALVSTRPGGLAAFDEEDTLFVTEGAALLRLPASRLPTPLATGLDSPRGLFVIAGHVVVVEARRLRAFPKAGGTPLVLYELPVAATGDLTAPRLVAGRLVFDQVCEQLAPGLVTRGNVEVDFARGSSRWLNDDPAFPFLPGVHPAGQGFRDLAATPEVVVGLVD